jgi:exoribonuclease R
VKVASAVTSTLPGRLDLLFLLLLSGGLFAQTPDTITAHWHARDKKEPTAKEVLLKITVYNLDRRKMPDNPNMPVDIYVPLEGCGDARDGEKVVVRVTDWQEGKGRVPIGKVTQPLGEAGGNDFDRKPFTRRRKNRSKSV